MVYGWNDLELSCWVITAQWQRHWKWSVVDDPGLVRGCTLSASPSVRVMKAAGMLMLRRYLCST